MCSICLYLVQAWIKKEHSSLTHSIINVPLAGKKVGLVTFKAMYLHIFINSNIYIIYILFYICVTICIYLVLGISLWPDFRWKSCFFNTTMNHEDMIPASMLWAWSWIHKNTGWRYGNLHIGTSPKTNMDNQNDGLEKVTPFKHGKCWYLC